MVAAISQDSCSFIASKIQIVNVLDYIMSVQVSFNLEVL